MITLRELMIGLAAGSVLILFGLVPRIFQGLAEGVREGVCNFKDSFLPSFPGRPRDYEQIHTPRWWLAGLGAALIAITVLAYA